MKLTQGCFSFLPDLTDEQITKQLQYAIDKSWAVSIEYTDDPHPRNNYWEMWGLPLFDVKDPAAILFELNMCRKAKPNYYIKLQGFDNTRGVETCVISFIVQRLIIGAAASGKSQYAEDILNNNVGKKLYLASANIYDEEMQEKVNKHKDRRGSEWTTIAEPLDAVHYIENLNIKEIMLFDCATMWLTNHFLEKK
jgi:ribulose-bisphosphate carboxylase small chain